MSDRLRVAVVGCGAVARRAHVPAWLSHPGVELAALCDPVPERGQEIVARYGLRCPTYGSLDELLLRGRPDIVDLCTPGFLHVEQARQALESGCHVLVEKPPAPSVAAAASLATLAQERGLRLGAVFNYRYRDLVMQLKEAAEDGLLGEMVKVYITHHSPFVYSDAPWLWDERRSRYLLWEFGIHFVDILVHLLGPHRRVIHVLPIEQPAIGHTTDLEATIEFDKGALGRLEITADTTRHSSAFTHINVYGTAQDAFVRWFPPLLRVVGSQVNPLALIRDEIRSSWDIAAKILRGQYVTHRNISHHRVIASYVDWVAGNSEYPMALERVLPTLRLLEEIQQHVPSYGPERRSLRDEESPAEAVESSPAAGSAAGGRSRSGVEAGRGVP